jgi:hypothetical protein
MDTAFSICQRRPRIPRRERPYRRHHGRPRHGLLGDMRLLGTVWRRPPLQAHSRRSNANDHPQSRGRQRNSRTPAQSLTASRCLRRSMHSQGPAVSKQQKDSSRVYSPSNILRTRLTGSSRRNIHALCSAFTVRSCHQRLARRHSSYQHSDTGGRRQGQSGSPEVTNMACGQRAPSRARHTAASCGARRPDAESVTALF